MDRQDALATCEIDAADPLPQYPQASADDDDVVRPITEQVPVPATPDVHLAVYCDTVAATGIDPRVVLRTWGSARLVQQAAR
jgi:hypothetical protein